LSRNRKKRTQTKKFFVEGVNQINLALKNKWSIDTFLYSKERPLSSWANNILQQSKAQKHVEMPLKLMEKLSNKDNVSELIALIKMKSDSLDRIEIRKNLFIIVLDRSSSPGNLGTIIRSCDSFEVDAIIMTGHSVDLYNQKTILASVGSIFSIPIIRLESHNEVLSWINKIKEKIGNFDIIGTTVKTDLTIDKEKFKTPLILLIGNETFGLSAHYKEMCNRLVKIPISGSVSSLNVGCATSIFLYEISKQIK
jgi:TrmH family RNA methyltransferase